MKSCRTLTTSLGTLAGRYIRGRLFIPGLDIIECLSWARQHLLECEIYHKDCESSLDREMPTRVVDLGRPGSGSNPYILETGGRLGKYIALSYCWGDGVKHPVKLKKSNYSAMLQGFVYGSLTRSHEEALQVAQILGYRYIWIDALCIIQDDSSDWEKESSRMTECYHNAALTLIAGESDHSSKGFLSCSFEHCLNPVQLDYTHLDAPGEKSDLYVCLPRSTETGPVAERAWCFQEDLLSRRKLIFGREQLFFNCASRDFHESGIVFNKNRSTSLDVKEIFLSLDLHTIGESPDVRREKVITAWYTIVQEFSACSMFDPHDVFAAFMGVAKKVQGMLHSRYLAGLWEDDIIQGLLWQGVADSMPGLGYAPLQRPVERNTKKPLRLGLPAIRAPSWSWASVEGAVFRGHGQEDKTMFDVANLCVKPIDYNPTRWTRQTDCDVNKVYMPVCELEMFGAPKEVLCSRTPMPKELKEDLRWRRSFSGAAIAKFAALVDVQQPNHIIGIGLFDVEQEKTDSLWCMRLVKDRGLLLRVDQEGKFHRLGKFVVLDEARFQEESERRVALV